MGFSVKLQPEPVPDATLEPEDAPRGKLESMDPEADFRQFPEPWGRLRAVQDFAVWLEVQT